MRKMGFDLKWIWLIMMCVTTMQYLVLVNGYPCGVIKLRRGLRQGDPISPYLFLFCVEGLSALLSKATTDGILTRVPTLKRGPYTSHLFFADDSLLFCRSTLVQRECLTNILRMYEEALGQRLSNSKTSLFFSKTTTQRDRDALLARACIPASQRYDTYLGLPGLVGKSQILAFRSIIDRVEKVAGLEAKISFPGRKEVLLKYLIQAILTYSMSSFLLLKTLCLEINSLMQKFWWNHQKNEAKIHWMSWRRMGKSKFMGGMGFLDFHNFNKALLAKQFWQLWFHPEV